LAREELTALEGQLAWSLQIIESQYFENQTEEDRTRLKNQLAELEKQCDEAKKRHEETVDKLFKTGSWPVGLPTAVEDDMEEEKRKEVMKYIQELNDTALQMSKILEDISMFKLPPPPPPPLFLSDESDGAPMDVDQPDDDNTLRKSLKRRRILDGRSAPSMPTREELDRFLDRLAHMESLISTLQNDINEHGREEREEFEQLVDTKLDEFQAVREEAERQRLEEEQRQTQALEQEITTMGGEVGELASEIGDLIIRVDKLEMDVGASRKEREESKKKLSEVGFFPFFINHSSTD
jgi:chromosome segregation ATPase